MAKPFLIGIAGGSGSGKSTFIRNLRTQFSAREVCIVSMDDYYRPRHEQMEDERGEKNFDLPESFDVQSFQRDLEQLIKGQVVERPEYTFNNENAEPKILHIHPAPVIVVEGLFVLYFDKNKPLFDLKIYIFTKDILKVIRRIHRDQVERGYPIDDVLYKYQYHVLPAYEKYIQPYKDDADIVINNNEHFNGALDVITRFIRHKLDDLPG